jgi:hypothetical protein
MVKNPSPSRLMTSGLLMGFCSAVLGYVVLDAVKNREDAWDFIDDPFVGTVMRTVPFVSALLSG